MDKPPSVMSDHPSDSELADMGDAEIDREDYRLAKPPAVQSDVRLPPDVKAAVEKAEAAIRKRPAVERPGFQFTIRDMLVLTTVVAFLMGLVASIGRGKSAPWIYFLAFAAMTVVWFIVGLKKAGYWRSPKNADAQEPSQDDANNVEEEALSSDPEPAALLFQYSATDVFLILSGFAFLLSLCTLLPGEHKLAYAAGITGLCSLIGLFWLSATESRHPMAMILWWLLVITYLLTTIAVIVVG